MGFFEKAVHKIQRRSDNLRREVAWKLGMDKKFYEQARGARIIVYHGICQGNHTRFNNSFTRLDAFITHLEFYSHYFNVISLDDYYRQHFNNNRFNICITFDDGFANNFRYVLPLLQAYKVPAAFFITGIRNAGYDILWNDFLAIAGRLGPATIVFDGETYYKDKWYKYTSAMGEKLADRLRLTGFVTKEEMIQALAPSVPFRQDSALDDYWQQMTTEEIRNLAASPYVTIGSHGYYHNDLAKIPISDASNELVWSKQYLENLVQKQVNAVAFPYGSYSKEVIDASLSAGYTQLLAMDRYFADDHLQPALKERFTVNPFISVINQMHANITGKY